MLTAAAKGGLCAALARIPATIVDAEPRGELRAIK